MVCMKSGGAVAVALIMVLSVILSVSVPDSSAVPEGKSCDGLLIYEVATDFSTYSNANNGFTVKNYGTTPVSMSDYYICDSDSGSSYDILNLTSSAVIAPGETATFVKIKDSSWFCKSTPSRPVYSYTQYGTVGTSFDLDGDGGVLHLYRNGGTLLDSVVYKKGSTSIQGAWSGPSVNMGHMGEAIKRVEPRDTDTYFDWTSLAEGYTAQSFGNAPTFDAKVTPFTFPECKGKPILDTIIGAKSSVSVSIYLLSSKEVVSELAYLAGKGVDIRVLHEGKPEGGISPDYGLLKSLANSGADVRFIGGDLANANTDRYSFNHSKYAVVDGSKVIITSENWTYGNIGGSGNRGWGVIVESTGLAQQLLGVFDNDFDGDDVHTFAQYESAKGKATSAKLMSHSDVMAFAGNIDYSVSTYGCTVRLHLSPDDSFKALQHYIDNADTRVFSEQQSITGGYKDLSRISPLSAMVNAADRGVDCRFLLGTPNSELIETLNSKGVKSAVTENHSTSSLSKYDSMHNKGVIIDDAVWVSSVNWTDNAFFNNRECGIYIMSPQVADYFAEVYENDWHYNHDHNSNPIAENITAILIPSLVLILIGVSVVAYYKLR